jgi:NAD(P)-dependent dehydrogenase (short-subunit alcohol dehydrogenase family)
VTGASRGLGEVIARILGDRGYDLVLGARQAGPLRSVAESIAAIGPGRVVPVDGDITDASVRARLVEAARTLGGLNCSVNNASVRRDRPAPGVRRPRFAHLPGEHR